MSYDVNIRAKQGKWVVSESCKMATKTIYWSHKTEGTNYFSCYVETAELEKLFNLKPGQNIQVRIRAKNRNGWGPFTNKDKLEVSKVPGKLTKPLIESTYKTAGDNRDRVFISW
jgi:hypothetical protein